ncbi:DUF3352 domain-containing protein [Isoptericola aurantiacus]|uniref:DUF3352 domain-containing protein n=1 Tax=Isoptericola aurantiacus TaxID=3377839 RepID=UPI00383A5EE6
MNDRPQPPENPADPPSGQDPEPLAAPQEPHTVPLTDPEGSEQPARGSRKGLLIGGSIAAGLLVLGGAGAAAYAMLDGGGAQPEAALPADTLGYVRVDLDPSAEQKINLLRLATRLPDLSEDLGVELSEDSDLKQVLVEAISADGDCEIDYDADVAPWIGERGAIAALPGDGDEPTAVGVLAVTDEDAARTALESGLGCGGTDATQVAFTSGYAIITDGAAAADVVAAAEQASLADDAAFAADMEALGDAGLVSFWADAEGILDWAVGAIPELSEGALDQSTLDSVDGFTTVAGALRANPDGIELETLTAGDDEALAPYRASGPSVTAALPETTLVAMAGSSTPEAIDEGWEQFRELYDSLGSTLGGGSLLSGLEGVSPAAVDTQAAAEVDPELYDLCEEAAYDYLGTSDADLSAEDQMVFDIFMESCTGVSADGSTTAADDPWGLGTSGQPDLDGMVALLADEFDIHLPDDLATLAGEEVAVAVDARGLDSLESVQGVEDVSVGVRTVGDTDALQDLAGRIDSLMTGAGMTPLGTAAADDGFVFATNDAYATELAGDGGLGSTDAFRSVVTDEEPSSVVFVDLDRLTDVLRPVLESSPESLSYLDPLRAVGMTSGADDTHARTELRVSFD